MANDNETVKQVCDKSLRNILDTFGKRVCIFDDIADEIEAAHNRELAAKDEEIERLRALVKELADALDEDNITECEQWCKCSCEHGDDKNGCETMCQKRALVARAREVTNV